MEQTKLGRPPLDEPKDERLEVRLTAGEKAEIRAASGGDMSAAARRVLLRWARRDNRR